MSDVPTFPCGRLMIQEISVEQDLGHNADDWLDGRAARWKPDRGWCTHVDGNLPLRARRSWS